MTLTKTHKRTKSSRMQGNKRGTHGWGNRKSHKKSGHRGGFGMSGTGKRADHKKTLILNLYGNSYFGKQGVTSRGSARDMRQRINLITIGKNLQTFGKKVGDKWEINLPNYKILGTGEVKNKLVIKCLEASKSAVEKVKKAGGQIISEKSEE